MVPGKKQSHAPENSQHDEQQGARNHANVGHLPPASIRIASWSGIKTISPLVKLDLILFDSMLKSNSRIQRLHVLIHSQGSKTGAR
jgi:hypothetical protein